MCSVGRADERNEMSSYETVAKEYNTAKLNYRENGHKKRKITFGMNYRENGHGFSLTKGLTDS